MQLYPQWKVFQRCWEQLDMSAPGACVIGASPSPEKRGERAGTGWVYALTGFRQSLQRLVGFYDRERHA
jgi:hypothetical protein